MLKYLFLFFAGIISLSLFAQATQTISIDNPSVYQRQELVSIPFKDFQKHFSLQNTEFMLFDKQSMQELHYQLEYSGEPEIQNILIAVDIAASAQLQIGLKHEKATQRAPKTYARYVPERKDDFAWENDLVAFRAYGKALEGTAEDAQGFDFWAKRTNKLVINDWYKRNNYHIDQGSGLDYYSVGQSLGVGDMALYYAGKVRYTKHYKQYEIVDNGPLRSSFKLCYNPEELAGRTINIVKTISIDAGSQLNKISLTITSSDTSSIPIVIGITRRKEEAPAFKWNAADGVFSYWEPAYLDNITGTGVLIPKGQSEFIMEKEQFLFKIDLLNNESFSYYAGAVFNKAGAIQDATAWNQYLGQQKTNLSEPLIINLLK